MWTQISFNAEMASMEKIWHNLFRVSKDQFL